MFGGINARGFQPAHSYLSPADNLLRFEFADNAASLTGFMQHGRQRHAGQRRSGTLGQILQHDELYQHYPEMASVPFSLWWTQTRQEASVSEGCMQIYAIAGGDGSVTRRHICHETQHLIQLVEGFSRGGSTRCIFNDLVDAHRQANKQKYPDAALRVVFEKQARATYRNLPGEKEARDVETRLDWTMQQRRNTPAVNSRLADDNTGVEFKPRGLLSLGERLALAQLQRHRRRTIAAA